MLADQLNMLFQLQEAQRLQEKLEMELKNHAGKKRLCELKRAVESLEELYNRKNERYTVLKKELALAELKSREMDEEIQQLEKRIYSGEIRSVRELKRLQEKQCIARRKALEIDENALKLMEEMEDLKKTLAGDKENIMKIKREFDRERLKTKQEIDKISDELKKVMMEKEELSKKIPSELLDKFEKIKKQKKDPVAHIHNGKCSGCRMDVSVMVAQEVNRCEKIVYCESCGRILI
ncbi:zinc ribbon domain-containing protein [Thermoanaerobacterium sp. DL9XJH110]|uniref:zinc ribbon domain-containing protein n=1 Tax=Thermoanaerobacterium sp. DL9XJH110 TaxID=3386643 RepID=UPI003BB4EB06